MTPVKCEIVNHEDYRKLDPIYDAQGNVTDLKVRPGSHHSFLTLRLSTGAVIRAEIAPDDLKKLDAAMCPPFKEGTIVFQSELDAQGA